MTRRPFRPDELDQPLDGADRIGAELDSYLADTATGAPRGLVQGVMAAVEGEQAPRRGWRAWLAAPSGSGRGARRFARATVLAASLVLAVSGAIFAGQLAGLIRNVGSGTPTPTETVSPTPSESPSPTTTASPQDTSSESPEASGEPTESPEPSGNAAASDHETPEPGDDGSGKGSRSPRPSPSATQGQ